MDDQAVFKFACEEIQDTELVQLILNNKSIDVSNNKNEQLMNAAKNQRWQLCKLLLGHNRVRESLDQNQIEFLKNSFSNHFLFSKIKQINTW